MNTYNIMYRLNKHLTSKLIDAIDSDDAKLRLREYYKDNDSYITIIKVELITDKEELPKGTIRY